MSTRKPRGGEISGGAMRVKLANLARGRDIRAAGLKKARGGLLHIAYKRKDPKTGKLTLRPAPDRVTEEGLYLRNARRLLKWAKVNDPEGFGELTLDDVLNTAAGKELDALYEENMLSIRGKRKPAAKAPKKARVDDKVDPYLKTSRVPLKNITEADIEVELGAIARVAPFMDVFKEGTGDFEKDVKLIRFVRKLLPKMPRNKLTKSVYEAFLARFKAE